MDCRVKPGNDDLKSAPMVRPLSCRGIGRPPQVKRNCLGGPPDHLDILRLEVGKCPILALAPLNAGITSFAKRSSCSKATFSGTPTERLTEMRSSAGYLFSSALMCSIRSSALPHRKPPALTASSMRGSLAVGARL